MGDSARPSEVASYAAAVRNALVDLTPAERDALLEDLDDHLAEVAAEAEGSLEERLGPPAQYARELRAAYGSPPVGRPRATPVEEVRRAVGWLTATNFYRAFRSFLPQLRPAWWVLRGYLAVLIVAAAFSPGYRLGPLPNLGTKHGLAEVALSGFAIWLSVRIGQRSHAYAGLGRLVSWSANGVIAVVALGVLGGMANGTSVEVVEAGPITQSLSTGTAFSAGQVTNIYPYSQDGKPLTNVLLFDQQGRPVTLPESGDPATLYPTGADGQPITNAYPLTQRHADGSAVVPPRVATPPWPSPAPTPAASATPAATPTTTH